MIMHLWRVVLAAMTVSAAMAGNTPFVKLSFEKALEQAKSDGKVVFIDFYATWCGPCKLMDRTTWKDAEVISWLRDKAVALKIDAEKEVSLARKYKISMYPTFVFLRADGSEVGRLMGYLPKADFLAEARGILSGKDPMTRAREKMDAEGADTPGARMSFARTMAQMGKYKEALDAYLWCFDNGAEDPAFLGVRGSFLLAEIQKLGGSYPPALEALKQRRETAGKRLLEGRARRTDFLDYNALSLYLGEPKATLELYDLLKTKQISPASLREYSQILFDALLEQRRYEEISRNIDLKAEADQIFQNFDRLANRGTLLNIPKSQKEGLLAAQKEYVINRLAGIYQVMSGIGKDENAAELAEKILAFDGSAGTYNQLAWNGFQSGSTNQRQLDHAMKAYDLSGGKNGFIIDTAARILDALDRSQEALALLKKGLEEVKNTRQRAVLEKCMEELERG